MYGLPLLAATASVLGWKYYSNKGAQQVAEEACLEEPKSATKARTVAEQDAARPRELARLVRETRKRDREAQLAAVESPKANNAQYSNSDELSSSATNPKRDEGGWMPSFSSALSSAASLASSAANGAATLASSAANGAASLASSAANGAANFVSSAANGPVGEFENKLEDVAGQWTTCDHGIPAFFSEWADPETSIDYRKGPYKDENYGKVCARGIFSQYDTLRSYYGREFSWDDEHNEPHKTFKDEYGYCGAFQKKLGENKYLTMHHNTAINKWFIGRWTKERFIHGAIHPSRPNERQSSLNDKYLYVRKGLEVPWKASDHWFDASNHVDWGRKDFVYDKVLERPDIKVTRTPDGVRVQINSFASALELKKGQQVKVRRSSCNDQKATLVRSRRRGAETQWEVQFDVDNVLEWVQLENIFGTKEFIGNSVW